jgi:hypothetical protein
MPEDKDFLISYKGKSVNISPVLNGGNIFFIVHLATDVTIAETMIGEDVWVWYESGKGETLRAAELGAIIEEMGV